ncbi:hypothetical protein BRDID11002_07220 [Bradyrhizobium diazoefficiens]
MAKSHILHGINFDVNAGEVVTLLGRNGAGKTTTLKSIMGIIGKRTGSVKFNTQEIIRTTSDKIARMGIAFCPEERGIFSSLDVRDEFVVAASGPRRRTAARADLRPVSEPEGAAQQPGHEVVRRRAADAGDRAHPAHRCELPDAGRADRRVGASHHPADRPHHCAAQEGGLLRSSWSSRTSGSHPPLPTRYYVVEHGKIIDGFSNAELAANMDKLHTYLGV